MVWNVYKTWQTAPNRARDIAIPQPA